MIWIGTVCQPFHWSRQKRRHVQVPKSTKNITWVFLRVFNRNVQWTYRCVISCTVYAFPTFAASKAVVKESQARFCYHRLTLNCKKEIFKSAKFFSSRKLCSTQRAYAFKSFVQRLIQTHHEADRVLKFCSSTSAKATTQMTEKGIFATVFLPTEMLLLWKRHRYIHIVPKFLWELARCCIDSYPLYTALVIELTRERFVALGLPSWTHLWTRYWGVVTLQGLKRFASWVWPMVLRKLGIGENEKVKPHSTT